MKYKETVFRVGGDVCVYLPEAAFCHISPVKRQQTKERLHVV